MGAILIAKLIPVAFSQLVLIAPAFTGLLATLDLLAPLAEGLSPRATLHLIEGGDHSFKVPKRSGHSEEAVTNELTQTFAAWAATL